MTRWCSYLLLAVAMLAAGAVRAHAEPQQRRATELRSSTDARPSSARNRLANDATCERRTNLPGPVIAPTPALLARTGRVTIVEHVAAPRCRRALTRIEHCGRGPPRRS